MCFHPDKCNVLSITQKQKSIKFTYKLHGHSLEKTDSTKYLGITLQSNLKWDKHTNSITSKANQTLGFLRRNLKVNSQKIRDHAYKALVRPKLEYSSCVWDPPTTNQINQLWYFLIILTYYFWLSEVGTPLNRFTVSKGAEIRNRYNHEPHQTHDTNGKVTNSQFIVSAGKHLSNTHLSDLSSVGTRDTFVNR